MLRDYTVDEGIRIVIESVASMLCLAVGVTVGEIKGDITAMWIAFAGFIYFQYTASKVRKEHRQRLAGEDAATAKREEAEAYREREAYWRERDRDEGPEKVSFEYEMQFGVEATNRHYGVHFMRALRKTDQWKQRTDEERQTTEDFDRWVAAGEPGDFFKWREDQPLQPGMA